MTSHAASFWVLVFASLHGFSSLLVFRIPVFQVLWISIARLVRFVRARDYWAVTYQFVTAQLTPVLSVMQRSSGIGMEQTKAVFITVFLFCSWIRKHHCQQFVEIRWRQLKEKKLRLSKSFAKKDIPSCRLALPVEKYFARKHRWQLSFILQPFCHNMILSTMPSEGLRMEQESGYQKFPIKAASSVCV